MTWTAIDPSDANRLYCKVGNDQVWRTTAATTANASTVWQRISGGAPTSPFIIASMSVSAAGELFVVTTAPIVNGSLNSPLFRVSGGAGWTQQSVSGLPPGGFGHVVADTPGSYLFLSVGARVFLISEAIQGVWAATNYPGLPGSAIWNLATVRDGSAGPTLLRAAVTNRGIWELNLSMSFPPAIALYLRDNLLDTGWTNPSIEGVPNPYRPTEQVWHYQCADIKIDARQNASGGVTFFQTDPETGTLPPLDHVRFDQLLDNSENLPQDDQAWIHVQVQNHSVTPSGPVSVWVIYARASAGVPALSASASQSNNFAFWSQFLTNGTIVPGLPFDSPWTSVGTPMTLYAIDAASPKVASFAWTIPTLSSGDFGHYCMVAFIHSASAPVGESTRMNVDVITPSNPRVGQKNLHIGPPLPAVPSTGLPPRAWHEYIEFHNPGPERSSSQLRIDLRALPKELRVSFLLTPIETGKLLSESLHGIERIRKASGDDYLPSAIRRREGFVERILRAIVRFIRALFGGLLGGGDRSRAKSPRDRIADLLPVAYEAERSALVVVDDVRIPPFGSGAMLLRIENTGAVAPGTRWRLEIQQHQQVKGHEGTVVGGSTLEVVMDGDAKVPKREVPITMDPTADREERERVEREGKGQLFIPEWMREQKELAEREREMKWHIHEKGSDEPK